MQEKYEFWLVVAQVNWMPKILLKIIGLMVKKKHKDDIFSLLMFFSCNICQIIKKIVSWEIEPTPDKYFNEENNYPDWYGYKKTDKI